MDASNVSSNSTKAGLKLVSDLYDLIKKMQATTREGRYKVAPPSLSAKETIDLIILAAHRLAFLEMVTKGLNHTTMHDAQAYAKFVEKKRKIEDMDFEELRVLLR